MTVLISRKCTLGVRLSAEEFSALEKFARESGARSMSDVARAAISKFMNAPNRKSPAAIGERARVPNLEQEITRLNAELALVKADRAQDKRTRK